MKPPFLPPGNTNEDDGTTARIGLPDLAGAGPRHLAISVFHADGVEITVLSPGVPVLVGRSAPADVRVPDRSLSRVHARFVLGKDERVLVQDLRSTNGTWVEGRAIERHELPIGGEALLGRVVVRVHALGAHQVPAGLGDEAGFRAVLGAVVEAARRDARRFAVLFVRAAEELPSDDTHTVAPGDVSRWAHRVQAVLGADDRIGRVRRDAVLALVQGADAKAAVTAARRILARIEAHDVPLLAGIALFPDAAVSADKLVDRARAAADAARADEPVQLAREGAWAREATASSDGPTFASEAMRRTLALVERAAGARVPVILWGETGTGKEVLARFLHERSPRRERPMISVNCAAIPAQLVESTLFGHERGAFTGATAQQKGVFEAADGGTVFLDEVGELPLPAQAALLRVLETQRLARVGSTRELAVDVRVVAATHRDLERMANEGTFRSDLYYRLATLTVSIPPLRARKEDIAPLSLRFLSERAHGAAPASIDREAMEALIAYDWPGNVRELRNAIERAMVVAQAGRIEVEDLPERVREGRGEREMGDGGANAAGMLAGTGAMPVYTRPPPPPAGAVPNVYTRPASATGAGGSAGPSAPGAVPNVYTRPAAGPEVPVGSGQGDVDLRAELLAHERRLLVDMLAACDWNKTKAAQRLGLPVRTLTYKMTALGIQRPER